MPTTPVTIGLGRNCTISVGGSALSGVRSVSATMNRSEIEVSVYGTGETYALPGDRSFSLEVETISVQDAANLAGALAGGTAVQISATNVTGWFIVTEFTVSEPLDDVVSYTATLKRTFNA